MSNLIALRETVVSFLTTGPSFQVKIPGSMLPLPELSSSIDILGTMTGRKCVFIPSPLDTPPDPEDWELLGYLQGPSPYRAELWLPKEKHQWWLRWPLPHGAMYMHIRPEDTIEAAYLAAERLDIVNADEGAPFVLPQHPLKALVTRASRRSEVITFFQLEGSDVIGMVRLMRPGRLLPRAESIKPAGPNSDLVLRGASGNVDVEVSGDWTLEESRAIAEQAAISLTPA